MSSGHTANGYVFGTALTCGCLYALAIRLSAHGPLPEHAHRFAKRDFVETGVGVALAIVATVVIFLFACAQFSYCLNCCCSGGDIIAGPDRGSILYRLTRGRRGRPPNNDDDSDIHHVNSYHPNDPERNLEMQPYESSDMGGREDARQHVSELGARPAPAPRRERGERRERRRERERREHPRRDQSDRLGALAAAHGSHGHSASQETLVDRPSGNGAEGEPTTKDITD